MIGGVSIDDDRHYVFFNPSMQSRWDAIVEAFKGEHLELASASKGFKKVVVRVDGMRDGFAYEIVDLDTMSFEPVGDVYEGVTPLEVRRLTYKAADGIAIPAYLTLPRQEAPERPASGRPGPRRPGSARYGRLRLVVTGACRARLRRTATQLPRLRPELDVSIGCIGEWGRKCRRMSPTACAIWSRKASRTPPGCASWVPATAVTRHWQA